MVVPSALQVCRMKSFRKSCVLGDLSKLAGWTKGDLISKLEESRKAKSQSSTTVRLKSQLLVPPPPPIRLVKHSTRSSQSSVSELTGKQKESQRICRTWIG